MKDDKKAFPVTDAVRRHALLSLFDLNKMDELFFYQQSRNHTVEYPYAVEYGIGK